MYSSVLCVLIVFILSAWGSRGKEETHEVDKRGSESPSASNSSQGRQLPEFMQKALLSDYQLRGMLSLAEKKQDGEIDARVARLAEKIPADIEEKIMEFYTPGPAIRRALAAIRKKLPEDMILLDDGTIYKKTQVIKLVGWDFSLSRDGKKALTFNHQVNKLELFDLSGKAKNSYLVPPVGMKSESHLQFALSDNGKYAAAQFGVAQNNNDAASSTQFGIWDADTGSLVSTVDAQKYLGHVTAMKFSSDNTYIALGTVTGRVYIWNLKNKKFHKKFTIASGDDAQMIRKIVFSADSKLLAVFLQEPFQGNGGKRIFIFNVQTGTCEKIFSGRDVTALVFSLDSSFLVIGERAQDIRIFDVHDGSLKETIELGLRGLNFAVHALDVSPDGKNMLLTDEWHGLRIVNLTTKKVLLHIPDVDWQVAQYNPDGSVQFIASRRDFSTHLLQRLIFCGKLTERELLVVANYLHEPSEAEKKEVELVARQGEK